MIATEDKEIFGVFDLVREQEANGFQGLLSPINVIAEKQIVGFWRKPSVFEESEKIVILAVDISANLGQ